MDTVPEPRIGFRFIVFRKPGVVQCTDSHRNFGLWSLRPGSVGAASSRDPAATKFGDSDLNSPKRCRFGARNPDFGSLGTVTVTSSYGHCAQAP